MRLRQELTHIGRVSALGELTASLAHELNQPLTAILSNAQAAQRLLAGDVVDLEKVREILSDIVADDKRAAAVISGLRGLLKKGEPEFVPLDLNEIVGEVAWLMRSDAIMRNVSMSLDLAVGPSERARRPGPAPAGGAEPGAQRPRGHAGAPRGGADPRHPDGPGRRRRRPGHGAGLRARHRREGPRTTSSSRSTRPRPKDWAWAWRSCEPSSDAHGGTVGAENNQDGGATFRFTLPVGLGGGR